MAESTVQLLGAALPLLIRLFWILATGAAAIALMPVNIAPAFRSAVLLSACRGKLMEVKPPAALGPLSDWEVPQRWFAHFYAVGAAWNALVALLLASSPHFSGLTGGQQATYLAALSLLQLHLIRRLLETVGIMKYPRGACMHGVAYLFGLSYYLVVPLTLLSAPALAAVISAGETLLATRQLQALRLLPVGQVAAALTPLQLTGAAVFLVGNALQLHSHALLAALSARTSSRRSRRSSSGAVRYRIPRGGAFEWVSCPHYLAEIVIYLGLALLAGANTHGPWLMVAWVVVNLLLAAGLTQEWYRRQFKTYPKKRRAIIPFVY